MPKPSVMLLLMLSMVACAGHCLRDGQGLIPIQPPYISVHVMFHLILIPPNPELIWQVPFYFPFSVYYAIQPPKLQAFRILLAMALAMARFHIPAGKGT